MAGSEEYGYGGLYDRAIRALSGARDWYSDATDPNRPRKVTRGDVNLPVTPPTPKSWYESLPVPDPSQIGPEAIAKKSAQAIGDYSNKLRGQFKGAQDVGDVGEILGKDVVTGAKKVQAATPEPVKQTLGHISGVVGASSEVPGRMAGAALDWADTRNTGSEQKPLSDVAWEGLKGVKSGYEKGALGATDVGQEVLKRTGSTGNKVLDAQLMLGLGSIDALGIAPKHVGTAALGALTGGPFSQAWLPPAMFKEARDIAGFTTQLGSKSHADKILKEGFGVPASSDILGRWGHASSYSPATAKAAKKAGHAPIGTSNQSYSGSSSAKYLPLDFGPEVKVLDTVDVPVPREDLDVILKTLHPVKDKAKIDKLELAWQDQAKYVMEHSKVRSGEIPVAKLKAHYKKVQQDPTALDAVRRLNKLLGEGSTTYGSGYGTHGSYASGTAPLNQPSMTTEFGAVHYPDYNTSGNYPSIAFDPRQTLFAPLESNLDPANTPWVKGKLAPAGTPNPKGGSYTGTIPADAPGGVSSPLPGARPAKPTKVSKHPQIVQPQAQAPLPPVSQPDIKYPPNKALPPKPQGAPSFMGKPISTYEQGTLKELEAAGRELTALQKHKLIAVKDYEKQYSIQNEVEQYLNSSGPMSEAKKKLAKMSPEAKALYKEHYPGPYHTITGETYTPAEVDIFEGMTLGEKTAAKDLAEAFGISEADAAKKLKETKASMKMSGKVSDPTSTGPSLHGEPITESEISVLAHAKASGDKLDALDSMKWLAIEEWQKENPSKKITPLFSSDDWSKVAKLQSEGHSEEEAIEFVKGGFVPDTGNKWEKMSPHEEMQNFDNIYAQTVGSGDNEPIVKAWNDLSDEAKEYFENEYPYSAKTVKGMAEKAAPPTAGEATMEQHYKDIQSIWEEHDVPIPGGKSADDFFDIAHMKLVHPEMTPENAHQSAIDYLNDTGHDKAAADVQELWDTKKAGSVEEPTDWAGDTTDKLFDETASASTKVDVFDPGSGKTLGTFDSPAEADAYINSHPDKAFLDWAPHDPTYGPVGKKAADYTEQNAEGFYDNYIGKFDSSPQEAVAKFSDLDIPSQQYFASKYPSTFENFIEPYLADDILGDIVNTPSHAATDTGKLPSALPEGIPGFDDVGKLPPVDSPLEPLGKDAIHDLDAEGTLDYLKNTYKNVEENFAKHSGTEMGSIESHTKDVLKQWKTQLTPEDYADISNRWGGNIESLMNVALPLHDIGKPGALAAGDKALQHSHTVPIMTEILKKEGFIEEDIALATELFNHDMIGSLLQGSSKLTPQQVADELVKKAQKIGMEPSDFAKLQLAFFQADASSYPFVTQYMKQMPNGQWISGSPKVKPIEDLIAGPGATKVAAPAADTGYKLKVADAEDMLGGTKSKSIYTKGGQDYLFKEANPPYFADQEVSANKVANLSGLHPIKIEKQVMNGKTGTMQAAVGNNMNWPTLKEVDLTTLTAEELRDVIRNHPVDWLTGNMDAHGAQFLRTPNGIVGIDRGRAFKSYQGNKLHEDYNPQGGPGFYDQVYNDMVKLYKKGKLPQLTEGDIKSALDQTIFKMNQNHGPIMQEIYRGLDRSNQTSLYTVANNRMLNLQADMLKFWSKK
jgi:hypothetical protein